jgi:hypothetical protein
MRWSTLVALTFVLGASSARADGLIYRLPEDGTAVRFAMDFKVTHNGMEEMVTGELVQRSVGKVDVDGKPCRWIEFKFTIDKGGQQFNMLSKVLIPESALKAGENPGAHMIRGWMKSMDREPEELKDLNTPKAGPLGAFLAGPPTDAKKLAKETVDSKLGKLECEGVSGSLMIEQGNEKVAVKLENRLNDKAPFGVVKSRLEFQVERNGQARENGVITLNVTDVAKDAKSELPEQK